MPCDPTSSSSVALRPVVRVVAVQPTSRTRRTPSAASTATANCPDAVPSSMPAPPTTWVLVARRTTSPHWPGAFRSSLTATCSRTDMTKKLVVLIRPDNTAIHPYADFATRDLISRGFEVYNQHENSASIADSIVRKAADYIIGPDALDTITHVKDAIESIASPYKAATPLVFQTVEADPCYAVLPTKANRTDAGFDLSITADVTIEPHSWTMIPT